MTGRGAPAISVVMPVYNAEAFLDEAIRSVLAQTREDWELLLVLDPGSADRSAEIAAGYAARDPRVRVLASPKRGAAPTRNHGIENARGDYVAFLDSDDLWLPAKLARQVAFIQAERAAFSCSAFRRFLSDGRVSRLINVPARITYRRLLRQNCINCCSVMIDRRLVPRFAFPEIGVEDYALWLALLREVGYCAGLREDLVRYRVVEGSRGSNKLRGLRHIWAIYREREKLAPLRASWSIAAFTLRNALKYSTLSYRARDL
jgi:teichuronic acid biosynthesis glycosyltransferase TuaG